jgi:hypothetical protein
MILDNLVSRMTGYGQDDLDSVPGRSLQFFSMLPCLEQIHIQPPIKLEWLEGESLFLARKR